ncbi:DUF3397 family protein [Paenibacillus sp. FJAT-26967]|uniref:DUF3397 family protein n=1 Tax=Paenibacillus sp. FJAT-26967 TaxID=1729690 RepID=UPI000ABE8C90|nr:DUF3397 family protein [Paenibacillus sp. FJAT-26967]
MDFLAESLSNLYAALAMLPILSFVLIWIIVYAFTKHKKKSVRITMDITTFLLLGSVASLWNQIFVSSFGLWFLLLLILIVFGLIGGYHTDKKGKVELGKSLRIVWRLSFMGLTVLYVMFMFIWMGTAILA